MNTNETRLVIQPNNSIKRLVIHYDEETSFDVRGIVHTNADLVSKEDEYLVYETAEPTIIDEGILQKPEFAVEMKGIMALEIFRFNGDREVRDFRKHKKSYKLTVNSIAIGDLLSFG